METSESTIQTVTSDVAMDTEIKPEVTATVSKQTMQTTEVMPQVTTVTVEGVTAKPEVEEPATAQTQEVTSTVTVVKRFLITWSLMRSIIVHSEIQNLSE